MQVGDLKHFGGDEHAGRCPVSDPAGSTGGRNAAVACSGHYSTKLPTDNEGN